MLTADQTRDIEYIKKTLIKKIDQMVVDSDKIMDKLTPEVYMSVIYLKIFSAYLQEQNFTSLEEAWKFMNDIKGIIDKTYYVNFYLERVNDHLKIKKA